MSTEDLFDSLESGALYYYSDPFIANGIRHFFLCIHKTNEESIIMSCCTTQESNRRRFIEKNGFDNRTLVPISIGSTQLTSPTTFIDCNGPIVYTFEELDLIRKHNKNKIEYKGKITKTEFLAVVNGIILSTTVDEATIDLLKGILDLQ